jgi:hypothetical protein
MFSIFAPAYIKEAELVLKNARKLLHYKKDLLSADSRGDFEATIGRLETAIKERNRTGGGRGGAATGQAMEQVFASGEGRGMA